MKLQIPFIYTRRTFADTTFIAVNSSEMYPKCSQQPGTWCNSPPEEPEQNILNNFRRYNLFDFASKI